MIRPIFCFALALTIVSGATAEERSAATIARELGFSDKAIERVVAGRVVAEEVESDNQKNLALAIVMRLDAPVGAVSDFVRADRLAEFQHTTVASGRIDPEAPSAAALTLPPASLARLVDDPAETFSLSAEEATRIERAARDGEAAALDAFRGVLIERALAFWRGGLAAITPYAGQDRSPAKDLAHANAAAARLARNPDFLAELEAIPAEAPGKASHSLHWAVNKGRDFAAPVLIHRILYREPELEIVVDRHFYSSYDYDALQIIVGILPTPRAFSAVIYTNNTYTAQVTGFGGGAKRSIGTKLLRQEVVAQLERAQRTIPKQATPER